MSNNQQETPKTMRTFMLIWIGQLISIVGSGMTSFGISVWIYQQTGQATPLALTALFYNLPRVLLSPFAGSVADRFNRRKILILADTGAAIVTLGISAMLFTGNLEIWHIYVSAALHSILGAFQGPAYTASITMIVPKKHLPRAGGIQEIGNAVQSLLVPVLAGILYAVIGLKGIILIDFATYFFAVGALFIVHIPQPKLTTVEATDGKTPMWKDAIFGWKYLVQRPGLFGLLWYYAAVNFFLSLSGVLTAPLILSYGTSTEMGIVQMAGGAAMLVGGLLMGTWGGPKTRRIWGVILAIALSGFGFIIAGLQPSTLVISIGNFVILFFIPISAALSQAVWQIKVPPGIQGRVFAIRAMIAWSIIPIANLSAGPLADKLFEPMMAVGGKLADGLIGEFIGVGAGRGIALLFIISGTFLLLISIYAFSNPRIRNLETEIPDAIPDEEGEDSE